MSSHENAEAERNVNPGAGKSVPLVSLDTRWPIWERFFTVAPLVIIGSREQTGAFDLAPKHMVTPLGWKNFFGFVCTPRHRTYQNISREGVFTVTFPRPSQVVLTSLSAVPRDDDDVKPALALLPTRPAATIAGVFIEDGYLFLECRLDRFVDGFGENSLVAGRVVAAQVAEDAMRLSDGDDAETIRAAPLLAYLAPDGTPRFVTDTPSPTPPASRGDRGMQVSVGPGEARWKFAMSDQLVRNLREDIRSRLAAMVAFLEALLRAESPSVVPESQSTIQDLLAGSLRDDGFRVRLIGGRGKSGGLLQASPRGRKRGLPYQLLIGHTDTVWPMGTLGRMPVELHGASLAGPGAFDMKGGLCPDRLRAQVAPKPGG